MRERVPKSREAPNELARLRQERQSYERAVRHALRQLEKVGQILAGEAVQLALAGGWKTWPDAYSMVSDVSFHDELLATAGDHIVRALIELKRHVAAAQAALGSSDGVRDRGG